MNSDNHPAQMTNDPALENQASANVHPGQSNVPVHYRRGSGRRIAVASTLFCLVLAAAFALRTWSRNRQEQSLASETMETAGAPPLIDVVQVHRAPSRKILTLPGEARALNETTIYARTNGYISKWLVDIGDEVKQGQTLAIIETPELDDQLNAAKAKVEQAISEAKFAQANADFARLTYERWQSAVPEGVVSEQERDEKKSEMDTSVARVAATKAAIDVDQAEVHRLQTLASFKNVAAPFDGTITRRDIDIGDLVTAGSTTSTTPLFSIARSDQLRVFVEVPQSISPEIKIRMAATVSADEYPGRVFSGVVDRMSNAVDRTSRTMRVEVIVPNPDLALKPGDYVRIAFQTDRRNPPLEIPASALAMRPEGPEVAVVSRDNTIEFHPVKIEQDMGDRIEIASGLNEGDQVALNISSDVSNGDRITPHVQDLTQKVADASSGTSSMNTH